MSPCNQGSDSCLAPDYPITLIAAVARNGVMGRNLTLPWRVRSDMLYFKQATIGRPVIMGRKTAQSIGKKLPLRLNIVVSRDTDFAIEGMHILPDLKQAFALAQSYLKNNKGENNSKKEIIIIGGAEIFKQTIALASKILLTWIEPKNTMAKNQQIAGDVFFPLPLEPQWQLCSEEPAPQSPGDDHKAIFCTYQKKTITPAKESD